MTAFSNNVKVGVLGSPFEAGLQAALMALQLQKENNLPKEIDRKSVV